MDNTDTKYFHITESSIEKTCIQSTYKITDYVKIQINDKNVVILKMHNP